MQRTVDDKGMRVLCEVMFMTFAFCWIHFFQGDLMYAAISDIFADSPVIMVLIKEHHLLMSVILSLFVLMFCLIGRKLFRFKAGMYGCNYLLAAVFLGIMTGYDGESLLGQSTAQWLGAAAYCIVLPTICKIVESIPQSSYFNVQRSVSGNLFLMSQLLILTAILGNTDENLHRSLRMQRLMSDGEYEELLKVGIKEEESDKTIDLLRAQAMLNLESASNPSGSGIGDNLFNYSISDPAALSDCLKELDGAEPYLASCLLDGDLEAFVDSIDIRAYRTLPKYYMQALVMADEALAKIAFPDQYDKESAVYDEFQQELESLTGSDQFLANSTYIKYRNSYYWFYRFRTGK